MTDKTVPHKLLTLIYRRREVNLTDAARILGLDEKYVMDIAKILREPNIIEVFYAISGDVILRPGKQFKKAFEERGAFEEQQFAVKKVDHKIIHKEHYVDNLLGAIRKRISEKKRMQLEAGE